MWVISYVFLGLKNCRSLLLRLLNLYPIFMNISVNMLRKWPWLANWFAVLQGFCGAYGWGKWSCAHNCPIRCIRCTNPCYVPRPKLLWYWQSERESPWLHPFDQCFWGWRCCNDICSSHWETLHHFALSAWSLWYSLPKVNFTHG